MPTLKFSVGTDELTFCPLEANEKRGKGSLTLTPNTMKTLYAGLLTLALAGCSQLSEDKLVALIKRTPGNQTVGKDVIESKIVAECQSNVGAKAYFGWIKLKPVEVTVDRNNSYTTKPMEPYKIYYIILDKENSPEEIHRGDEYYSILESSWRKIGCGALPSVSPD